MNAGDPSTPNRRQVLKGFGVLAGATALGGLGVVAWRASSDSQPAALPAGAPGTPGLDELAEAVTSGGPGKDGIPSIDEPRFVPAGEAGFLADDEPVFGLDYRDQLRAYPQQVLVWHEIVNDTVAGEPLSVTYCPLTGTVIGFPSAPGQAQTFGTTGNLVNSNLLMYDRQTDSEWPQLLGTAIRGPRRGQRLDTVPLVWTTWKAWRNTHPGTSVLSADTGALRSYGSDPYGSYTPRSGYYAEDGLYFPVQRTDDRFRSKDVVLGVRGGDQQLAIPKDLVRRDKTVEAEVGGATLVARWDDALGTARVVHAGTGESADFLDAMWFAWYAFYPGTAVLA
jgi:hypothetical protein